MKRKKKNQPKTGIKPKSARRATQLIRILGLELGGGKSERTSLVMLDYYPSQKKIFLAEHRAHLSANFYQSGDEVLIGTMHELRPQRVGVNAPLTLPPCTPCRLTNCRGFRYCHLPQVHWMHEEAVRARLPQLKHPTPYTQRAVDVFLRTRVQQRFKHELFIEETLGAGRAPLAMRMQYLRSRFRKLQYLEVVPRLALLGIADWFQITDRELRRYRTVEDGMEYRFSILGKMQSDLVRWGGPQLFLYEAERQAIAHELISFHALLSSLMVVYQHLNLLEDPDADFDPAWGFVAVPKPLAELE